MSRHRLSHLFVVAAAAIATLHAVTTAQQAAPARPRTAEPVRVTCHESFAALAPRLLALLPAAELAKVDATLAADDRPGIAARLAALAPALGDVTTAWIDPQRLAGAQRFVLRIGLGETGSLDVAQHFVQQLVSDWTLIAPGDVWHVAFDKQDDWWELGGRGEERLCVAVSRHGLTIANSPHWFGDLRRGGCLDTVPEPLPLGHLSITAPLQQLRPQPSRHDEIGRWLQVGLDVLGTGTARIDVELDALDRLAAFLPR